MVYKDIRYFPREIISATALFSPSILETMTTPAYPFKGGVKLPVSKTKCHYHRPSGRHSSAPNPSIAIQATRDNSCIV